MATSELIQRFKDGPRRLREAVAGMTPEQARARPIPGKWSTLEVVAHIADFEVIGTERLMAVFAEEGAVLPGRDENHYCSRLAYDHRDLETQLRLIEVCRSHVGAVLAQVTDADWERRGIHSQAGPLTLEQLLRRVVDHLEHHAPFILEKRKTLGI